MKLIFLGSGSAFTVGADNFHSNMFLVSDQGAKLLIDCGSDIRWSLHAAGFSHLDVTDIYVSHLHSDHVGGLEHVGFNTLFDPQCQRPNLYISKELASDLWDRTLAGGMRILEGDIANLETYFNVHSIDQTRQFIWEDIRFQLVQTVHVNSGFGLMPSYGLFFELEGAKVFLSTDTQLCWDFTGQYYNQADVIFHDCETSQAPTPVHSHYSQLVKLPAHIKQKMWLYGYQPGPLPNAVQDGFRGFVNRAQAFEFSQEVSTASPKLTQLEYS